MLRPWRPSVSASTAYPWPSSWPLHAATSSRRPRSWHACRPVWPSSPGAPATSPLGCARCGTPSRGATTCWTTRRRPSSVGCRSSWAASAWMPPRRCTDDTVNHPGLGVVAVLSSLVESSLVRPTTGLDDAVRFGMLETIREFGIERLDAAGERVGCAGCPRHVLRAFAERPHPNRVGGGERIDDRFARIESEQPNIQVALLMRFTSRHAEGAAGRRCPRRSSAPSRAPPRGSTVARMGTGPGPEAATAARSRRSAVSVSSSGRRVTLRLRRPPRGPDW